MSVSVASSSLSRPSFSLSSPSRLKQTMTLGLFEGQACMPQHFLSSQVGNSGQSTHRMIKMSRKFMKRGFVVFAASQDHETTSELRPISSEEDHSPFISGEVSSATSPLPIERSEGKPGLISFYGHPHREEVKITALDPSKKQSKLLWFIGPAVLVASLVFPSLYLRRVLSTVFEDSLLTDFLILFFTEALFYGGVAIFVLLIDHMQKPDKNVVVTGNNPPTSGIEHRISSVATLVLSLIIPMVTMGFVWPWTGPAASATLAPYLVGLIVQFAFEQYARYRKSVAWPVIPVVFQVYRLHQLNRAAQLVTALSFSVRGAETTSQTMAINSSLGTLMNVLQFLGVICIWSLSSFLMRFFPTSVMPDA